jgi:large subunit ribosomal protein L14e
MMDVGRLCMKVAGREAGKYCVIVKKVDANFVMVTGPRELTTVKRRRCNVAHLEPLNEMLEIKSDASDDEVLKAFRESNLVKKLDLEPSEKPAKADKPTKEKKEQPKKVRAPRKKAEKSESKKD